MSTLDDHFDETLRFQPLQVATGGRRRDIGDDCELDALIDAASVENYSLATDDGRSITDVALEMLSLAKWID